MKILINQSEKKNNDNSVPSPNTAQNIGKKHIFFSASQGIYIEIFSLKNFRPAVKVQFSRYILGNIFRWITYKLIHTQITQLSACEQFLRLQQFWCGPDCFLSTVATHRGRDSPLKDRNTVMDVTDIWSFFLYISGIWPDINSGIR